MSDWVQRVRRQIEPFLSFDGANAATMVNNLDWTAGLSTIDFLRDIGKHFPVNRMLARDTVKRRLESGISYTEFSYILLQSMDYLNLYRTHGVRLQFGGSDQWGNLTGGVELIRRSDGETVHAFATPLVTKADGTKYGKTEGGALWLDPEMMSPYSFFQFWLNVEDEKVGELLRVFTFLSREEIEALEAEHAEKPFLRAGQRTLARAMTTLVHGEDETARIETASAALFGGGDLRAAGARTLDAALSTARPVLEVDGLGANIVDLLVDAGLVTSKGEARRAVAEGGAYLNNERVEDPDYVPVTGDLIEDRLLVLRRGKKNFARGPRPVSPDSRWLADLEDRARAVLPAPVLDYVLQAAGDGITASEATQAWRRVRLLPHVMRDVTPARPRSLPARPARRRPVGGARPRPGRPGCIPTGSWRRPGRPRPSVA